MHIKYDMKQIGAVGESEIAEIRSNVLTVVNPKLVEQKPEVARYFRQYVVSNDAQSEWVLEYGFRERPSKEVAEKWIRKNLDTVAQWLEGVETRDGKRAIKAVRAAYGE